MYIVALQGRESVKKLVQKNHTQERAVIPFVGARGQNAIFHLGLGFMLPKPEEPIFWGYLSPRCLLRSWRGMKLAEELTVISDVTALGICWELAGDVPEERLEQYASYLVPGNANDPGEILALRERVRQLTLPEESLQAMIAKLEITVDEEELRKEFPSFVSPYVPPEPASALPYQASAAHPFLSLVFPFFFR